jgi:hypothetical protein
MKWMFSIFLFGAFILPVFAQEFNAGFVQGLWYSEENVFADKTVRVYVAIRNNTGSDLTGTVNFYDNDKKIGSSEVSALDGRIIESWIDWTPTAGEHTVSASLSRTKLHAVGESAEVVTVTDSLAKDALIVDFDTDDDGVGNEEDVDDDGDGISDAVEKRNGTDPLEFNAPEPEAVSTTEEAGSTEDTQTSTSTTVAEGIEHYLTPSRADSMLGGITQFVNTKKKDLDEYRQSRAVARGTQTEPVPEITVNEDGFGEIVRSTEQLEKEPPKVEKPGGFLGDIITFIGTILGGIYTGILAALSFYLGHPVIVQLSLLFLILFAMFKVAQKLSARPQ